MRRGLRPLDLAAAVAVVACLLALAALLRERRIEGSAFAVDGDTLIVEGRRIRLRGLDAPEIGQSCERGGIAYRCGEEARAAIRAFIAGEPVACAAQGRDRYGRDLATCRVRGEDIGARLVRSGQAVSFGAYGEEEREAREARRGIWAGSFEQPQAWRRRHGIGARS